MKFIDEVQITVESGHGGAGAVSFRREKHKPRGGPDGGDGGKGGDVIFRVDPQKNTLFHFAFKKAYKAEDGHPGGAMNMSGAHGENLILPVPPGTVVKSSDGNILFELLKEGEEITFLKGGRGGKGNDFFKTSVNQAPTHAQPGEEGQIQQVILELKLLADIGIIGFPNAGKSTLISHLSAARPRIADYPFTTLEPNLGVVQLKNGRTIVMADIPGLIPGAHEGVGLGIRFLKHIERTRVFVHLIDVSGFSGREPLDDFKAINHELQAYDQMEQVTPALTHRPQIVALNKIDVLTPEQRQEIQFQFQKQGHNAIPISASCGYGLDVLLQRILEIYNEQETL